MENNRARSELKVLIYSIIAVYIGCLFGDMDDE